MGPTNRTHTAEKHGTPRANSVATTNMLGPTNRVVTGIAIALIALVVVGSFVWAGNNAGAGFLAGAVPSESNPVAIVHDSDGNTHSLQLNRNQTISVTTDLGTNEITVEDGEVYISSADCDGHDCMRQGRLSVRLAKKQLICLPHKLWIEIRTSEGKGTLNPDVAANDGGHLATGEVDEFEEDLDTTAR